MSTADSQLTELQSRISFQEDAIATLNEVVTRQDAEIQTLQEQLQVLYKKIDELKFDLEQNSPSGEAPPPHY